MSMRQLKLLLRLWHTIKTDIRFVYEIWSETLYMELFDGVWYVGHSSLPGFSNQNLSVQFPSFGKYYSDQEPDPKRIMTLWYWGKSDKKSVSKSKQKDYFWFLGVSKTPLSIQRIIRRRHRPRAIPWLPINSHAAVRASSDDSVYCKNCPKFGFHSLNRGLITCPSEYQDLPYLYQTWSEGNISRC